MSKWTKAAVLKGLREERRRGRGRDGGKTVLDIRMDRFFHTIIELNFVFLW